MPKRRAHFCFSYYDAVNHQTNGTAMALSLLTMKPKDLTSLQIPSDEKLEYCETMIRDIQLRISLKIPFAWKSSALYNDPKPAFDWHLKGDWQYLQTLEWLLEKECRTRLCLISWMYIPIWGIEKVHAELGAELRGSSEGERRETARISVAGLLKESRVVEANGVIS